MIDQTALQAQAADNNRYLDTNPAAITRRQWVLASVERFRLTVASWPDDDRIDAWRTMMIACDAALRSDGPPPVDHDPYPDEPEPTVLKFPENF